VSVPFKCVRATGCGHVKDRIFLRRRQQGSPEIPISDKLPASGLLFL
jgi:hypothetical protein